MKFNKYKNRDEKFKTHLKKRFGYLISLKNRTVEEEKELDYIILKCMVL